MWAHALRVDFKDAARQAASRFAFALAPCKGYALAGTLLACLITIQVDEGSERTPFAEAQSATV